LPGPESSEGCTCSRPTSLKCSAIVRFVLPAITDARHFGRLGIQSYGFMPMQLPARLKFSELIHNAAERIPVGKRAGHRAPAADETMAELALSGRRVVRLKSGDATIFDRIGEEVAALEAHGIGCDVVPGVVAPAPPVTPWRQALPAA
jgi:hypothetical protein